MLPISNFAFLSMHDVQLAHLGALAERYFTDDPATAIFKLRQFAELLSKTIAAHHALYQGERETFEDTLRRLSYERIVPKEVADVFHTLRKVGNRAAHETTGNHSDALSADSDEVARAFRDDVARCSDMMSPGVRCLAGG
jgi:type I restriction enzyme R subunit